MHSSAIPSFLNSPIECPSSICRFLLLRQPPCAAAEGRGKRAAHDFEDPRGCWARHLRVKHAGV